MATGIFGLLKTVGSFATFTLSKLIMAGVPIMRPFAEVWGNTVFFISFYFTVSTEFVNLEKTGSKFFEIGCARLPVNNGKYGHANGCICGLSSTIPVTKFI